MYKTVQGDTWDIVAKNVYGNELLAGFIMQANYKHIDIVVFSAGTELNTPDYEEVDDELPEWRD